MANWALVILTFGLVIVTFLYMRHTKRMADIMAREYESKVTPLVDIKISRRHSSEGFKIQCTLVNRGFRAIRTQKLVMKWWYKNQPATSHLKVEELADGILDKDGPISRTITIRDDEIKNPEISETQSLEGYHLGKIVAARIWLDFYDVEGQVQSTATKALDPLMT